jgi:hypothetical protein
MCSAGHIGLVVLRGLDVNACVDDQIEAEVATAKAKAEEEGEEVEEDGPDVSLTKAVWRLRTLGVTAGGDGPEMMETEIKNTLSYEGKGGGGAISAIAIVIGLHEAVTINAQC